MENRKLAYPKLSRIKHNSYYLGIVQNLYCGKESDMVSFLQMDYQAKILAPYGSKYGKLFSKLSKDDLFHSSLLSEIILSLGGDPALCDTQGRWISGRWVDYVKNIKQMLLFDIELKEKQIIEYKTAISKIDYTSIKQMLGLIARDKEYALSELKSVLLELS